MKKRNLVLCIIFSIITCGLYNVYWMYTLAEDVNWVSGKEGTSGALVVVFSLLTCGIYGLYWLYKSGDTLDQLRIQRGRAAGYLGILYVALAIFSLGIVAYVLMQAELNEYAAE